MVPRDKVDVVEIFVVAIHIPPGKLSSLPGDTKSDGYPCVAIMDNLGEMDPIRRDGLPVLPLPRSNEETPPIPDSI